MIAGVADSAIFVADKEAGIVCIAGAADSPAVDEVARGTARE